MCKDAAERTKHNEYLENKLLKIQEESRQIGTTSTLNKDQLELLRIHESHHHVTSAATTHLIEATGTFPKSFSKRARPACATCYYRALQRNL